MIIRKTKIFPLLMILSSLLLLSACGGISANSNTSDSSKVGIPEMTINLAGVTPPEHPLTKGAEKFKEIVEKETNGKVKVDHYPNLQLGSIREQTEQVQLGTIHMTQTLLSTITSFNSEALQVFEYPFLWPKDENKIWEILSGEAGKKSLAELEKSNFKGFGYWAGGFKAITNTGDPILTAEDLKGVKMRVIPSEILQKTYKAYGANPVPIEFSELYNALQQGVVNAQENPLETIMAGKYYEVQDHLTVSNHGYQFYMIVANLNWFNSLSQEMQEIIIKAEEEARNYARQLTIELVEKRLKEFKELGLEIHEISDEARQEFIEMSLPLHDEFSKTSKQKELLNIIYKELGM